MGPIWYAGVLSPTSKRAYETRENELAMESETNGNLMSVNPVTYRERRTYPRFRIGTPSEFMAFVGVLGAAPSEAEVVDIRLGGSKIRILEGEGEMMEGETCFVRFLGASETISPDGTFGSVRRIEGEGRAPYIAVEFESPLDVLHLPSHLRFP